MIKQLAYIFSRKEKAYIVLLFGMAVIGSILECVGVGVFMPLANILMDASAIEENEYLSFFYNHFAFQTANGFLTALSGAIIFIFVFKNVYMIIQKYLIYSFSYRTQQKISTRLLKAYMNEPYTFFLKKNIAVLQRSMQEDATLFTTGIIHFMELIVEITTGLALAAYLYYISKSITVIIIGLLVVCVGVFTAIARKYAKRLGKDCQEYKGKLYQWMNQALGGIKEIKVLNRENFFIDIYERYYKKYAKALRNSRFIAAVPKYVVEMVCMSGLLIAIIIKMNFGKKEAFLEFIPQLAAFAVAAFRLLPSVGRINEHVTYIMTSAPSIELVYKDLKEVQDVTEKRPEGLTDWNLQNEVRVKNLCYKYPETEENVIEYASMEIKRGQTVAIIGQSGAGKTTLVDVILGLLIPQYGKIKADDMDVFKNIHAWQKAIGYIPQTIYLSDDTIKNNVAFGVPENEIDSEAVNLALQKAQMTEFISGLADGQDTVVGERGIRLSGGQRQRIGIARALYHDPEILILDEATSALDNDTETAVMEAIENLHGEKTMIIIAHRLTTIKNADVIYEVVDGKVQERRKEEVL